MAWQTPQCTYACIARTVSMVIQHFQEYVFQSSFCFVSLSPSSAFVPGVPGNENTFFAFGRTSDRKSHGATSYLSASTWLNTGCWLGEGGVQPWNNIDHDPPTPPMTNNSTADGEPNAKDNKEGQQNWADVARKHTELDMPKRTLCADVDNSNTHGQARTQPASPDANMYTSRPSARQLKPFEADDEDELWTLVTRSKPLGRKGALYIGNLYESASDRRETPRVHREALHPSWTKTFKGPHMLHHSTQGGRTWLLGYRVLTSLSITTGPRAFVQS